MHNMASTKEIKSRMESVKDTKKITNAMYLIASTKLRRARSELDHTRPYFEALRGEIKRIFRTAGDVDSPYFYPIGHEEPLEGTYGCLVITADKGLAGAYNQNVLKKAEKLLASIRIPSSMWWANTDGTISSSTIFPWSTAFSTPPRTPPCSGPERSAPSSSAPMSAES